MKTIEELKQYLEDYDIEDSAYLSEPETISAIVGHDSETGALIYDYDLLVDAFMKHFDDGTQTEDDLYDMAVEWIEYNTKRSLPYTIKDYKVVDDKDNELAVYGSMSEASKKAEEISKDGKTVKVVPKEYVMPIIMEGTDVEAFEDHDKDWVKAPSKEAPVFDVEKETNALIEWIRDWFEKNGKGCNAIIGLSGGKDSTIVAALCAKALGSDRVIGVSMPDAGQGINEADEIAKYLGIRYMCVPIGEITNSFKGVWHDMGDEDFKWSDQAAQNIPPRIRMTVEYALAQTYNGRPSCNCNLSEDYIGYATLGGDSLGSFAPLSNLTVTEIKKIGHYLGLPEKWVEKIPDDGLPHSSPDEEKFGFTYTQLDRYIRHGICEDEEVLAKIEKMHENNVFKTKLIQVPSYKPSFMSMSYAEQVVKFE